MAFPETQVDRLSRQRAANALLRAQPGYVNPASPGRVASDRVYQDGVGNAHQQMYGNSQANRGGSEGPNGYVPHPAVGQFSVPPGVQPYEDNPHEVQLPTDTPTAPSRPQMPVGKNGVFGAPAAPAQPRFPVGQPLPSRVASARIDEIMNAPAPQGPVMDSPRIQAMRAQKDANVSTYNSMGRSPEMQARMDSGYNKAMRIGQSPADVQAQPQSIFQRQAPPNNRMQGSVPVGPSRDMSGANGVRMGELRPNTGNVAYVPSNGTDGSVGSARYVEGRRLEPLTPGGRGTVVQRGPNGGMELIGDELTDEQRQDYANQSARVAQARKDRALADKDTRAMRALGRNPTLKNRPAVADALVRRAESVQGKAKSMADARVAEARDRAFRDESFALKLKGIDERHAKIKSQWTPTGKTPQQLDQEHHAERDALYRDTYGTGGSGATARGGIDPSRPSRQSSSPISQPPQQVPAGASVGMPQTAPQRSQGSPQRGGFLSDDWWSENGPGMGQFFEDAWGMGQGNQQPMNEQPRATPRGGRSSPIATPISMPIQSSMYDQMEPAFGFGSDPSRVINQVPYTENSVHGVPWPGSVPQPQFNLSVRRPGLPPLPIGQGQKFFRPQQPSRSLQY